MIFNCCGLFKFISFRPMTLLLLLPQHVECIKQNVMLATARVVFFLATAFCVATSYLSPRGCQMIYGWLLIGHAGF